MRERQEKGMCQFEKFITQTLSSSHGIKFSCWMCLVCVFMHIKKWSHG